VALNYFTFKKILFQASRIGLEDSVPDEDSRVIMVHNSLAIVSALLLSPFPLLFWLLEMKEGLLLSGFAFFSFLVQFALNWVRQFFVF